MSVKDRVRAYWESNPCDLRNGSGEEPSLFFESIARKRYALEPFIHDLAEFKKGEGKRVLEIGVGLGVDFSQWIIAGARAFGVDLTSQALRLTRANLEAARISRTVYHVCQADAEILPFQEDSFDLVYSWGALHHTPDTEAAIGEAFRVLAPGGTLKAMVYHVPSWTGWLLWVRHALMAGKPFSSVREVMARRLESPGTKAFTAGETIQLIGQIGFQRLRTRVLLGPSDLLRVTLGNKYRSPLYWVIQALHPRWLVKALGDRYGLYLFFQADKPHRGPILPRVKSARGHKGRQAFGETREASLRHPHQAQRSSKNTRPNPRDLKHGNVLMPSAHNCL
jgi:SAM-dependent methyltransferase